MEKEKKLSFFKKFIISIKNFEKYGEVASQGVGRAILYFIQLMIIFSVIVAITISIKAAMVIQDGASYIKQYVPDFEFRNSQLLLKDESIQEDKLLKINENNMELNILLNTNDGVDENKYIEKMNNTSIPTITFLKEKMIVKTQNMTEPLKLEYKSLALTYKNNTNLSEINFTKQDILNFATGNQIYIIYILFFIVTFIYVFLIWSASTALDAVMLGALGWITSRMVSLKMKYSATFSMSICALTLPIILNIVYIIVNMFTGFEMQYFQVMYTVVAYICLIAAILLIRSELIKNQVEVQKIIEEQRKIHQELEQKKKEEQERKQKEKDNKKEDKKEEKPKEKEQGKSPEANPES